MVNSAAYHSVRRSASEDGRLFAGFEDITHTAYRMDQLSIKSFIDFVTQSTHTGFHQVSMWIKVIIPYMFNDHQFRYNAPGIAHKIFKETKLFGLQADFLSGAGHFSGQ